MKTKLSLLILLPLWAMLGLSACHPPGVATVKTTEDRSMADPVDTRIQFREAALADKVRVEVNEGRASGDLLRLQVRFRNLTSREREYFYQLIWIDEEGFELDVPTPQWERIGLLAYEEKAFSQVAYSPKANDFILKISPKPGT